MRGINRIKPFLEKIQELWLLLPDYRFSQIISLLEESLNRDMFYAEEDVLLKIIQNKIDKQT